jgi:hypothetical protein
LPGTVAQLHLQHCREVGVRRSGILERDINHHELIAFLRRHNLIRLDNRHFIDCHLHAIQLAGLPDLKD